MDREHLRMLKEDLQREARQFETWRGCLKDTMQSEYGITSSPHVTTFNAITLCINRAKMELLEAAAKVERLLESEG